MPQTILALFALMLSSTFALQQSRHTLHAQLSMVQREARTHAQGIASEVFADIGRLAFDEATIDADGTVAPQYFTAASFEVEAGEEDQAFGEMDDIDDVHGAGAFLITREVTRPDGQLATLRFAVTASVEYAEIQDIDGTQTMAPTADGERTATKLVTLQIRCLDLDSGGWTGTTLLTLSRPFSYTPARF